MQNNIAKGYQLSAVSAGFRKIDDLDLAFVLSDVPAKAAAVFTTNLFKAAPVLVSQKTISESKDVRGIVVNTGQANACTGNLGIENCKQTLTLLAKTFDINSEEILPASTGVIGAQLKMDLWEKALPNLKKTLGLSTIEDFAKAIMTTDSFPKYLNKQVSLKEGTVTLTAFAKGAGMICPNMATMISIVLCDANVDRNSWQLIFSKAVESTFNRVSVDGDTSTNDTLFGLANGASGVNVRGSDLDILQNSLEEVLKELAYMLVQDGEGATKVIKINVREAFSESDAEKAARTIGSSQLVKTAMYGKDANWGRIVAALGRSGALFNPEDVKVSICDVMVFEKGQPTTLNFDEMLKKPFEGRDISIDVNLNAGSYSSELFVSDLTHEYVSINADYRS